MPIDFAAVAARFSTVAALQLKLASVALTGIGRALAKRATADRAVELATRGFPIVRFYDGAVTMRLAPGQRAILTVDAPSSLGRQLAQGGLDFVSGIAEASAPFRSDSEATAIPRFLDRANRAVAAVEESVRRFQTPDARMFDPDSRTTVDLFGLAGLAFAALAEASDKRGAIEQLTAQIRETMGVLGIAPGPATAIPAEPVPTLPPADTLDTIAFELLGGAALVGALPELIDAVFDGLRIATYQLVLTEFGAVEAVLLDARHAAFKAMFVGLTGLVDRAEHLVRATEAVFGANLLFTLRFWRGFGVQLAVSVRDFVIGLGDFLGDVVRFMGVLPDVLTALTRVDLTELLAGSLGGYAGAIPSFALGDLLDGPGTRINTALRDDLLLAIQVAEETLRAIVHKVPAALLSSKVRRAVRAIGPARTMVLRLFDSGGSGAELPVLPEGSALKFHSDFPDVWQTMFGHGRDDQVMAVVRRMEQATRLGVHHALRRAGRGLDTMATEFADAATRSARTGRTGPLTRIAEQSDQLADLMFGPEIAEQQRNRDDPFGPLAAAFETWLVTAGFEAVSLVIDGYVAELAAHWGARIATGTELTAPVTPTSPHLLRKHAVLSRVVVPRLTLHVAPGRALDDALAEDLAREFTGAARTAYRTGHDRLRAMAELPDAGGR